jgi:sulfatase maturation enzyme AslB (radical SAM superfamily)
MGSLDRKRYLDWPAEVSIETLTKCNARCTFCPYPTLDRIGTKMPDELIDKIINELKDHPREFTISPFKVNEPFLDKRLLPLCRRINDELPNAHLRLFTNGSALTEKHIDEVSELVRVTHLWVSLNDHRPDEYHRVMGLDFERTAKNLDLLHAKVESDDFPHRVVVSKVNADAPSEDAEFGAYVAGRWPLFDVQLIRRDGWLGHIEPGDPEVPDKPCGRWFELNIMANGIVAHCCMDSMGEHSIGDLNTQSLFEVYNGRAWRKNRLLEWSRKNVFPCRTCSYGG